MPSRRVVPITVDGPNAVGLRADAINGISSIATFTLSSMTENAKGPLSHLVGQYDQFAAVLQSQIRNSRRTFLAAHQRAAIQAQSRIVQVYQENVEATKGPVYRVGEPDQAKNRRYAGGALLRALEAPNFFAVSYSGVALGNVGELDATAKQWARLNYGAGSKGSSGEAVGGFGVGPYTSGFQSNIARFMNAAQKRMTIPGPRPAFRIPRGFWFSQDNRPVSAGGGGDKFYPYSTALAQRVSLSRLTGNSSINPEGGAIGPAVGNIRVHRGGINSNMKVSTARPTAARITAGIAARKFIDAGVAELFSYLGTEYSRIVNNWYKVAAEQSKGPIARGGAAIQYAFQV